MTGAATLIGPGLFGFTPRAQAGNGSLPSGLEAASPAQTAGLAAPAYSPDNPLFWFAAFLAGAAALILYSGRVKLGASVKADAD